MKITRKEQLEIIEGLCIDVNNRLYYTKEDIYQAYMELSDTIYKVAHLNSTCKNPHLDWHKEVRALQQKLRKAGIITTKEKFNNTLVLLKRSSYE